MYSILVALQKQFKRRSYRHPWILTVIFLLSAPNALAHGGGLNSEGCHNNRRTGDYHCHRAQPSHRPAAARSAMEEPVEKPTMQQALTQQPREPAVRPRQLLSRQTSGPTCYTGPRGGTYTITASGRKNYGGC
ncbi:MAG TPA: YHYH domain-containing protein [Telluria sp.]|jgi:hypothetical protein